MKLKSKASLIMAGTVVLALATIGVAFYFYLEKSLRSSIYAGLESVAAASSDSIWRFVSHCLRDAQAVAAGFPPAALARRDVPAAEAYLARMAEVFPQFDNGIFLLDAQGRLWADYPAKALLRGQYLAHRDYFERTKALNQGIVARPYQSARTQEPVCTFTAPILGADGQMLAVLGCSVKLSSQESLGLLRSQKIGESGYFYVIDQTRLIIMHADEKRILKRDIPLGSNLLLDKAFQGFEGVGETINSRGVPMLVAFKRVPLTDWVLAAQQPKAEALAPLQAMQARLALGILAGALLAGLVGIFAIRGVTKPVSDLALATQSLEQEPLPEEHPILARGDEIGDLARSYQELWQGLRANLAQLHQTEQRLNTAQSVAHVGSWELDLATREIWGSEEAHRIYGLARDFSGRLPLEQVQGVTLPEDRPRMNQALQDLLAQRAAYAMEFKIGRFNDGQVRGIFSRASYIPSQDGSPGKVVGTIQDITERLRYEESLRQSEERFRQFSERSPLAVWVVNSNQEIEYVNHKFTLAFGYSLRDIPTLDHWWVAAYPDPDYRREVRETWTQRVIQAHQTDSEVEPMERWVRCQDGADKMAAFYGAPIGDKTIVMMLDVTMQWEASRALQESETKLRRFVEATPAGIHMYHFEPPDLLILSGYNPAAERILGMDHRPLLGQTLQEAFPELQARGLTKNLLKVASQGGAWRDEDITYVQGRIAQGYEVQAFRGAPDSLAVMFNDITERLRTHEELRILEQQLARSQKLEAVGTLASGIAHEFNNLLAAVMGYSEMIQEAAGSRQDIAADAGQIIKASERGRDLVRQLLAFSRKSEPQVRPLSLNAEIRGSQEMLTRLLPKTIAFDLQLAPELSYVSMATSYLHQVLLNLFTNAAQAMPEGGTLGIKTENVCLERWPAAARPWREITSCDGGGHGPRHGPGNPAAHLRAVFLHQGPGQGYRTGPVLGLRHHPGARRRHHLPSQPAHGTTFTLLFPRSRPATDDAQVSSPTAPASARGSETVLLVDDEPEILEPLAEALASHGYQVHTAGSGEEALDLLAVPSLGIDVIVMDINMPGMGGEKALGLIKAQHPQVKIIAASGFQDRALRERLLQAGADLFIGKPFDLKELLSLLRQLLARRGAAA